MIEQALHLAKSLPFTDKMGKNSRLSVNPHHNWQKFTDKSLENAGLSVNLNEILDRSG